MLFATINLYPAKDISKKGIIEFVNLETGCWIIKVTDKEIYYPINLDKRYEHDGLKIEFKGKVVDVMTICMIGIPIKISLIKIIGDKSK